MASNARRPIAAAAFTTAANTIPPTMRPYHAVPIPTTHTETRENRSIVSTRIFFFKNGPTKLAPRVAKPDRPIANPNQAVPAISRRSQNARWKNMNPTTPRNTRIAFAAATTEAECSSSVSNASAGKLATTIFGRRYAFIAAAKKARTPNPRAA